MQDNPKRIIVDGLSDKAIIWRYMDFTKFVDLLGNSSLYFCNVTNFEDPFDSSFFNVINPDLTKAIKNNDPLLPKGFGNVIDFHRHTTYVNCWHRNKEESAALWRLYATVKLFL